MYILVVTGLSGSGKSHALSRLEDRGFFCIDNLPSAMLRDFVKFCSRQKHPVEKAAIVIDSRESIFNSNSELEFYNFDVLDDKYDILFLECRNEEIERRYNETRRRHPINANIKIGVMLEREFLHTIKDRANFIIDTSDLKPLEFDRVLDETLAFSHLNPFSLIFQSFGYKRGVPYETDMVFDMRFLQNPFYEPSLRYLSGMDKSVVEYLEKDKTIATFLDELEHMLRMLIPRYKEQGKHRLMLSFGCTGGRHRSVYAANEMYKRMKNDFDASLMNRDLINEGVDIKTRLTLPREE
ncbi:MAG: RNase adapter RapZ [Clostridia bacterium]